MSDNDQPRKRGFLGLSRNIVALGFVSLLTDLSSEMMIPILPLFMQDVIRAPVRYIGLIEGFAESTASLLRVYAGWLSDRFGRPKLLTVTGYGLSTLAKPLMALATVWPTVLGLRFAERFGKGIRSAPRDVIITESVEAGSRGKAFGFHRAMDTTGAVLGPLAAVLIISHFGAAHSAVRSWFVAVFLLAAIPAILGVVVLAAFVSEKPREARPTAPPKIRWRELDSRVKVLLLVVAVFSVGNSSDAFLILRAKHLLGMPGLDRSAATICLMYALFNVVSAAFSLPAGMLSDRIGRRPLIGAGLLVFAAAYLGFALVSDPLAVWALFAVYGLYVGLTAGALRAFAADLAPPELRGTVIGAYYTVEGLCLLPASLIAGLLWDYVDKAAPFFYGAGMALLALAILLVFFPAAGRRRASPAAG